MAEAFYVYEADADELEQLRASARYIGALRPGKAAWLGVILRERMRAGASRAAQHGATAQLDLAPKARLLIRSSARRSATAAALSAACAHLAGLATVLTDGLAGPLGVPIALACVAFDTVYLAIVQVDLACDLAAIYEVPFDARDVGEVATLLDVALFHGGAQREVARSRLLRWLAPPDKELLRRLARGLVGSAAVGLIPLAGFPWSIASNYVGTRRVGARIHRYVRRRRTVRDMLSEVLSDPRLDKARLLEGAWLLASCDDEVTEDELGLLSALVRSIPRDLRPPLACLRFVGEGIWVVRMALLGDEERRRILGALETLAALRGPMTDSERAFLDRIGNALGEKIDLRRIARLYEKLSRRAPRPPGEPGHGSSAPAAPS